VPSTTCPVPTLSPGFAAHALEAYSMDDGIWTALDWDALFGALKNAAVVDE
jgi:hypothetical protein